MDIDQHTALVLWPIMLVGRYSIAAGYSVLLYDTLLMMSAEIQLIWTARNTLAKWAYLANKYAVIIMMTGFTLAMSGIVNLNLPPTFCKGWLVLAAVLAIPSMTTTNVLALLRVAVLWQKQRRVTLLLLWVSMITTIVASGICIFAAVRLLSHTIWTHYFGGICIFIGNVNAVAAAFATPAVVDIIVCVMTFWNVILRRNLNASFCNSILLDLWHDGFFHFLVIFATRLMGILLILIGGADLLFIGIVIGWSLVTIILGRFIIRLHALEKELSASEAQNREAQEHLELASDSQLDIIGSSYNDSDVTDTVVGRPSRYGPVPNVVEMSIR